MVAIARLQGSAASAEQCAPLDVGVREKLLSEHLPEVRHIARRIHVCLPLHVPLEDLVHAGVISLIDAVDKFDPLKHVQLKSHAKFRIRGAILDSLRASDCTAAETMNPTEALPALRQAGLPSKC